MQKLDRSRDFGTITPVWQPDDFDRPAYYEQDGKFYDAHDIQIEPGKPLPATAPQVSKAAETVSADTEITPYQLLKDADVMPWAAFRKHARRILGDTCPASKSDMLIALQEAVQHYEERQQKRKTPKAAEDAAKSAGLTWGGLSGEEESLTAKPQKAAPSAGVDLAAWARGQQEYVFGEIRKAIRTTYSASVTERRDALDLLIQEKVVTAAEARKDIQ